jgi:ADP-heptose:LPS heptosyltransferase
VATYPQDSRRVGDFRKILVQKTNREFDLAIDLQGTLESARWVYASDAKYKGGFAILGPRKNWIKSFRRNLAQHTILEMVDFLKEMGITMSDFEPEIFLEPLNRTIGKDYIIINPFAEHPNRCWPIENFQELFLRLKKQTTIVIMGGPCDKKVEFEGSINLIGKTTLYEALHWYKNARLMITGDTGPMHAAAALGTRVVSLFGASFAQRNGPWGQMDTVLQPRTPPHHHHFKVDHDRQYMKAITVDSVFDLTRKILKETNQKV